MIIRWWDSPLVREHINRLVSGRGSQGFGDGVLDIVKRKIKNRVFNKGVSVGCGTGCKEIRLIKEGVVKSFSLFEFSEKRIEIGRESAEKFGVADSVTFRMEDAFKVIAPASVDFIHWSSSLHHMLDVDFAVKWSHQVLKSGGMFYLDDFVGPTRFQWSEASLKLAKRIRSLLPQRYLRNPYNPTEQLSCEVIRPNPDSLAKLDPSEAAQSGIILDCVRRYFPDAEVILTGGTVYHLALNDILHNFDEADEHDAAVLRMLLLIDELCIANEEYDNHYATAIALKP